VGSILFYFQTRLRQVSLNLSSYTKGMPSVRAIIRCGEEYLLVTTGENFSEEDKVPLRITVKGSAVNSSAKEIAREKLRAAFLERFHSPTQALSPVPFKERTASGTSQVVWKSRVYKPHYGWGFVSGTIEPGEDPLNTLMREISEEIRIAIPRTAFRVLRDNVYEVTVTEAQRGFITYRVGERIKDRIGEIFDFTWTTPAQMKKSWFTSKAEPIARLIPAYAATHSSRQ
jgi:8-oxo-dGTP pyrophosphatase MutT (NUDIX family)